MPHLVFFLIFGFQTALFATLFDTPVENASTHATCTALVRINTHESFAEEHSNDVYSVFGSEILENVACGNLNTGDRLYFAAPGGTMGIHSIRINGFNIEEGQEIFVHLGEPSNSVGVPLLLKSFAPGTIETEQTPAFACARSGNAGPSLFWKNRTVVMRPSFSIDTSVTAEDLADAMKWAGDQWSNSMGSDFGFQIGEPVSQRWVGYDWSSLQPNFNVVTLRRPIQGDFYSDWLHASRAIAMTTLTYIHGSGEIIDADIELNAHMFQFTNCAMSDPSCVTLFDLKNTLTHEYGHVLGLDHPDRGPRAAKTAMFEEARKGETMKRILSADDHCGIAFIYPKGKQTQECFSVERKEQLPIKIALDSGCAQIQSSFSLGSFFQFAVLLVFSAFLRFILPRNPAK